MKKIIALAFATLSCQAMAADWYFLNTSNRESAHYFDAATLTRNGSRVDVWMKNARLFSPAPNTSAWVMSVRWRIDCKAHTMQSLSASFYDKDGKLLMSEDKAETPTLIAPDSASDAWQAMLCDVQFPRPQSDQYIKVLDFAIFHGVVRQAYSEAK